MISRGLLNFSLYKLSKMLYYNYIIFQNKEKKLFKQRMPLINYVKQIKYNYEYRK
jgi:hypothetical protein